MGVFLKPPFAFISVGNVNASTVGLALVVSASCKLSSLFKREIVEPITGTSSMMASASSPGGSMDTAAPVNSGGLSNVAPSTTSSSDSESGCVEHDGIVGCDDAISLSRHVSVNCTSRLPFTGSMRRCNALCWRRLLPFTRSLMRSAAIPWKSAGSSSPPPLECVKPAPAYP